MFDIGAVRNRPELEIQAAEIGCDTRAAMRKKRKEILDKMWPPSAPSIVRGRAPVKELPDIPSPPKIIEYPKNDINNDRKIGYKKVITAVSDFYKIDPRHILGRYGPRHLYIPRHIAIYLQRRLVDNPAMHSLSVTGRIFDDRDHTTIMNSIRIVEILIKTNPVIAYQVAAITNIITGNTPDQNKMSFNFVVGQK